MPETNELNEKERQSWRHITKHVAGELKEYFKSRFNRDNWFGSVMIPFILYGSYQSKKATKARLVHGKPKVLRTSLIASNIFIAEKIWSFFSARGGEFPEGETAWRRMVNAIKHPQISSTQFEYLILMPSRMMHMYNLLRTGLKAHGIGLKPGEVPYEVEKINTYIGLVQMSWIAFLGLGHFKKHEKPSVTAEKDTLLSLQSQVAKGGGNIFHVIKETWKHDRSLCIGIMIEMLLPSLSGVRSWSKSDKSPVEARYIAKSAATGAFVAGAYGIYTFNRIAKSNYSESMAHTSEGHRTIQDNLGVKENNGNQKFTNKLAGESRSVLEINR